MAFGNPVTDFANALPDGTAGYIIAIDLKANLMRVVSQVQVQDTVSGAYSAPVVTETSQQSFFDLVNSSSAPDVAFFQTSTELFVFLNGTTYPYVATNRIAFIFWRNTIQLILATDNIDVPQEAMNLLKALTLRFVKQNAAKRVEFDLSQSIITEKSKLKLT